MLNLNPCPDRQQDNPVSECEKCRQEVYHGEARFQWEGRWALPGLLPGRGQQGPARLPGAVGAGDGAGSGAVCLMATLLFFDQGHKYTLDGEELPSVSELCRFLSREIYGDVAQWRLDNAADRGTAVHKACESLDKFGSVDVQDAILPYLQAYLKFRREHAVEWRKIEYASHHPGAPLRGHH